MKADVCSRTRPSRRPPPVSSARASVAMEMGCGGGEGGSLEGLSPAGDSVAVGDGVGVSVPDPASEGGAEVAPVSWSVLQPRIVKAASATATASRWVRRPFVVSTSKV